MGWWGKLVGGTFGFMMGGPLGALLGAAIGHSFDKGLNADSAPGIGNQERVQTAFFTATFSVMGHIAKADGQVSASEIAMAERIIAEMKLDTDQRKTAINLFNEGKSRDFPLDDVLTQFRKECHRRNTLIQMFIEIQLHAMYADGRADAAERAVIEKIAYTLGIPGFIMRQLEALVQTQYQHQHQGGTQASNRTSLEDARRVLGVSANDDQATVKKAYRRLMNQHHPDKLVAKGLPEEMVKLASEKTHEIKMAYEAIKRAKGW
ncbi:MAG: co-chaperone DjlA [Gammaproteobacteria bacterium]|nr:co-chaperone DjlA [Gammaproteobacteria bacterium]